MTKDEIFPRVVAVLATAIGHTVGSDLEPQNVMMAALTTFAMVAGIERDQLIGSIAEYVRKVYSAPDSAGLLETSRTAVLNAFRAAGVTGPIAIGRGGQLDEDGGGAPPSSSGGPN